MVHVKVAESRREAMNGCAVRVAEALRKAIDVVGAGGTSKLIGDEGGGGSGLTETLDAQHRTLNCAMTERALEGGPKPSAPNPKPFPPNPKS